MAVKLLIMPFVFDFYKRPFIVVILIFLVQCEEIMEVHEDTIISLLQNETPKLATVFCREKSKLCPKKKTKTEL